MAKIAYGTPIACTSCGEAEKLSVYHSFGAQIRCPCGNTGPFVSGSNYQSEERNAISAWNKALQEKSAPIPV
jgi:hypothetical protein